MAVYTTKILNYKNFLVIHLPIDIMAELQKVLRFDLWNFNIKM